MKKLLLFATTMFVALTINAQVSREQSSTTVDLYKGRTQFHKIGAGNPLVTKCRWEECDCHALNCLTKLVIIF